MSHSQFHSIKRLYLDMHGLIFETSVCYWQNQPGCYLYIHPDLESFDTASVRVVSHQIRRSDSKSHTDSGVLEYASNEFISSMKAINRPTNGRDDSLMPSLVSTQSQ